MNDSLKEGLIDILSRGGFVMPPLVVLSLALFTALFRLAIEVYLAAREDRPARSSDGPNRESTLGEVDFETRVSERNQWRLHFNRRIKSVQVMIATAPLLGLLGTVAGMLKTFSAMSLREGFEGTAIIASGISQALITTETGLSIAIFGMVFLWAVRASQKRLLIRLETRDTSRALANWPRLSSC